MSEISAGVCRLPLPGGRWLATGPSGGYRNGDAAYNVSVPEGFDRTDLADYADGRLAEAGFDRDGPVLFTGVDLAHARGARTDSVTVVATAGLSNPARLPLEPTPEGNGNAGEQPPTGTVNLLVTTTRALGEGTLATLLSTAVEAKTATLQAATGFSGTTSDGIAVGCDPAGRAAQFAGSATDLGTGTRVCVREAVLSSLDAHGAVPDSVAAADHGVVTGGDADCFRP
jgi:adenosylcobinamide hydrolase